MHKLTALPSITLRELAVHKQRCAGRLRIASSQLQEPQTFWEPIKPETRPTEHSVLLEGIVVHHLDPVEIVSTAVSQSASAQSISTSNKGQSRSSGEDTSYEDIVATRATKGAISTVSG